MPGDGWRPKITAFSTDSRRSSYNLLTRVYDRGGGGGTFGGVSVNGVPTLRPRRASARAGVERDPRAWTSAKGISRQANRNRSGSVRIGPGKSLGSTPRVQITPPLLL